MSPAALLQWPAGVLPYGSRPGGSRDSGPEAWLVCDGAPASGAISQARPPWRERPPSPCAPRSVASQPGKLQALGAAVRDRLTELGARGSRPTGPASPAGGSPPVFSISTPPPEPEEDSDCEPLPLAALSLSTPASSSGDTGRGPPAAVAAAAGGASCADDASAAGVPVFDLCDSSPGEGLLRSLEDDDVPVFDITGSPADREHRWLCDVLWSSRPLWAPRDLVAAERKLARVGIETVAQLLAELEGGSLNPRLRAGGQVPFNEATLKEFQRGCQRTAEGPSRPLAPPEGARATRGRQLCDMLWEARPQWAPADLAAAERKLAQVGVEDLAALDDALVFGLNRRLREAGLKAFSAETTVALRRHLDKAYGRVDTEDKQAAWMQSGALMRDAPLRDVLWECRPTWSASELAAAEHKLARVGVQSVATLAHALSKGLNSKLRAAGLKAFNTETVRELRRRLAVAPAACGDLGDDDGSQAADDSLAEAGS